MKYMNKNDRRVIKTRNSIRKAFNELILKKDIKSIKITEIASLADIDRKTFYLHYDSIEDILEEFRQELLERILNILKQEKSLDIKEFFKQLNDIMMEDIEVYKNIAKKTSYMFLLIDCKNILKDSITESFYKKSNMSKEVFNIYAEYISAGIIGIYVDWLNSKSNLSLEELTKISEDVVLNAWKKIIKY